MKLSEFDQITEKLGRLFTALEQASQRLEELMEITAAARACVVHLQAGLTFEEEDPNGAPAIVQYDPSTFLNGDYEWTQTADVLPHEGQTVLARWIDGVMNWTYYRKSVEYPGAFCFYDQFGHAVTAPKEWLSARAGADQKEETLPAGSLEQSAVPAPAPQEAAE